MQDDTFDRVNLPEPLAGGRLATLGETGIPAYQVASLAIEGETLPELLERFPSLDETAIFQAMAFVVRDYAHRRVAFWSHAGREQTARLLFKTLLVQRLLARLYDSVAVVPDLANRINALLADMEREIHCGSACWNQLEPFGLKVFSRDEENARPVPYQVAELLAAISQPGTDGAAHVRIELPDDLPQVIACAGLRRSLKELVSDIKLFCPELRDAEITVTAQRVDADNVQICMLYKPVPGVLPERSICAGWAAWLPEAPGVAYLVHELGSALEVHALDDTVEYRFTLSVWKQADDLPTES